MAEELWSRLGGAWRRAEVVYTKVGAGWTKAKEVWYRDAGTWRRVFLASRGFAGAPSATAAATDPTDITFAWTADGGTFGVTVVLEDNGGTPLDTFPITDGGVVYNGDPFALYQLRVKDGDNTVVELVTGILPDTGV